MARRDLEQRTQHGQDGGTFSVGEQLAAEAAQFLDSVIIIRLTADFPGCHIWRRKRWDARLLASWVATRRDETAGVDATVMMNTAEQLGEALADQRDLAERLGLRPVVEVSPGSDAS